jgi:hypothetical protein
MKIFAFWVAATFIVILVAFANAPSGEGQSWEKHGGVRVWTDPKTGCRYTPGDQGMSPLVGPDGKPDCVRRP